MLGYEIVYILLHVLCIFPITYCLIFLPLSSMPKPVEEGFNRPPLKCSVKFETLNYCGSNEGSYEIRNPSSPNASPNPQTLKTTFLKKTNC